MGTTHIMNYSERNEDGLLIPGNQIHQCSCGGEFIEFSYDDDWGTFIYWCTTCGTIREMNCNMQDGAVIGSRIVREFRPNNLLTKGNNEIL
jgi:hypothetical protein